MTTQIFAKPDNNGIIRVSCGSDMFEIHVIAAQQSAPQEGGSDLVGLGDSSRGRRADNPFRRPGSYLLDAPRKTGGGLDIEQVLEGMRRQFADPDKPDPKAIVLSAARADLHDLRHLGDRIGEGGWRVSLGVDFSGS